MKKILLVLSVLMVSLWANPKVLMVATSHDTLGKSGEETGIWLSEFTHAYIEFEKAGFDIVVASPVAKNIPIDKRSIKNTDKESLEFLTNPEKRAIFDNSKALSEVKKENFDIIYLVGGHGVMWDFPQNSDLKQILVKMAEKQNIISAVCHGPSGFIDVNYENGKSIIEGIKITGFSNTEEDAIKFTKHVPFSLEDELVRDGAIYSQAKKDFDSHIVVDKNFVTGQNPASAKAVALQVVQKLK